MQKYQITPFKIIEPAAIKQMVALKHFCKSIGYTGELRRRGKMVSCIELVCVPLIETIQPSGLDQMSMFGVASIKGNDPVEINHTYEILDRWAEIGRIKPLQVWGSRSRFYQVKTSARRTHKVCLFFCKQNQRVSVRLFRTAHYSLIDQINSGLKKHLVKLTSRGLNKLNGDDVPINSESDIYDMAGIKWVDPRMMGGFDG